MEPIVFMLVCEGPSDILVIKKIAEKISQETGRKIEIRDHAPIRDSTTGEYPEFGWKKVRQWCRLNGSSENIEEESIFALIAKRKSWRAYIGFDNILGFIIHLDTDIAHVIDQLPFSLPASSIRSRKKHCKKALLNWLDEKNKPDEVYFLLPTHSTETWLLSTHERNETVFNDLPKNFDFEKIDDVEKRLIDFGYKTHIDKEGNTRFTKHENVYKSYAQRIINELTKVRSNCLEADLFCKNLESR
jgi:hypothetical protein